MRSPLSQSYLAGKFGTPYVSNRWAIDKAKGKSVPTFLFLDKSYAGVSAVAACSMERSEDPTLALDVVHNHFAKVPVPHGLFGPKVDEWSPSRMARKAAASHSPPKTNSGAAAAGRSMRALSRLADVARFWTLDRTTITGRSAVILRQHTTPFRPMIVPFDDLELVYQSLRNSSRHIRANFRASMRRTPNWAPFNLET